MAKFYFEYQISSHFFTIVEENGYITRITLNGETYCAEKKETPLINKTVSELKEYFAGNRKEFTIPIYLSGTPFEKEVYKALQKIPYGQSLSYSALAILINRSSKACRAIGNACHKNPLLIVIPCHRVVGKNNLGGFFYDLNLKKQLLVHEQNHTKQLLSTRKHNT